MPGGRRAVGRRVRLFAPTLALAVGAALTLAWARGAAPRAPEAYFGLSPARPAGGAFVPAMRLGNSDYCGACHTDVFHQWNSSAHHFSSFNNPFYRHVAVATRERKGPATLKLCAGCHDPLPLLAGEMDQLDLGAWSANAGITCLACHRISRVHGHNGAYELATPALDAFALTDSAILRPLHSAFVRALPALHRAELSRDLYRAPEYCGSCHRLVTPGEVNGAGDLTVQDDYGQWRDSPFAGHAGAGERQTCIDCHMPLVASDDPAARNGLIRSHRFLGGNTALPALNRDDEQLAEAQRFLRARAPRLVFAGLRQERGQAELQLQVTSERVGHNFPGGTSESNEAWLAVEVHDAAGRRVFASGVAAPDGSLPGDAVFLRAVFLDRDGRPTDRGTTATEAVAAGEGRALAPAQARSVAYRFRVDAQTRYPLRARARLNWRKFSPAFTRQVFGAREVQALPITILAEAQAELGLAQPARGDGPAAEGSRARPPARGGPGQ